MTHFQLDDKVRVVRLLEPEREDAGSSDPVPQPRVGDTATVVADVGEGLFVESCTDDGMTVWMGEFAVRNWRWSSAPAGTSRPGLAVRERLVIPSAVEGSALGVRLEPGWRQDLSRSSAFSAPPRDMRLPLWSNGDCSGGTPHSTLGPAPARA